MTVAYIGLGSNLNQPLQQIKSAITRLAGIPKTHLKCVSRLYRTAPLGSALDTSPVQPDYLNATVKLSTHLSAHELLDCLHDIENAQGRIRTADRWSARTLDLDLLLYGDEIIDTHDLVVPHPAIQHRSFVLYPLLDITPDLNVPQLGSVKSLIKNLSDLPPKVVIDAALKLP
ncbi:MAG: hypothetical protein A6F71_06285 [Cycloclasticus sp. symbiont of Poecilosclerida sp. M]|nr:MAG: hypothetical protein A6F71_06285 [Cycloclasticus sp. symbiont of Poecilosclerida sp. M]